MDSSILLKIAKKYKTPVYVYDEERIRKNFRDYLLAFRSRYPKTKVYYALKANTNLAILRLLRQEGACADVVSGGELKAALKAGFDGKDIIYSNNAKTIEEINQAIKSGAILNIDSMDELNRIHEIAKTKNKKTPISFRVNPSIDPKTHPKISTGMKDSKFGIHIENNLAFKAYRFAAELETVEIKGVHMHIGSQITDIKPFLEATDKLMEFVKKLEAELEIRLEYIDIGGGLGINYEGGDVPTPDELAAELVQVLERWSHRTGYEPQLWLEPGRYVVGNAGILLCEAQSVKETPYKNYINLDCGFNTLLRPAMYGSYHKIANLSAKENNRNYDVVGNICESGDILGSNRSLPETKAGDILAIYDVGAYGFSMSSQYNSRPRPPEVLVWGHSAELIREREDLNDLFNKQNIPDDLL
ncbi:MAG: diaminopimelate decarboxylase [Candidatus Altiarchaeales archaeon ex4484_96]|nr:MAG: diaminopimelate decarboxylase [Candidatus Altiarchaeales archaeon ex4484_96]